MKDLRKTKFDSLNDFDVYQGDGYLSLSGKGHDINFFSLTVEADVTEANVLF